jgi:lipid II:glycine glycyltransferase (peptidoglycan interpeptide bridge formation enzyme)
MRVNYIAMREKRKCVDVENFTAPPCLRVYVIISRVQSDYHILQNPDLKTWDDFVSARSGHLLQTFAWGELKSRFGWSAQRVAIEQNGALVAGAQILFRRLPFGLTLAYVPRGPIGDPNDRDAFAALFDAIGAIARARGAFALKIEPDWLSPIPSLATGDWRPATCFQPHTTIHLDLTRDHETILARMKPKWRYNIRLAERKGVIVRAGNAKDLPKFYDLLKITSARDKFQIHTFDYYRAAFELLTTRDYARLFIAEYAGEPIAAIFVSDFAGEAIYLYGASGNSHRERMPNHALHWHAMQWAKARGCTHYDLWGVGATAEANADSDLPHGLYQFKQGFGGEIVRYAGAYDVIFSRVRFGLYKRALAVRRGAMG